MRSRRISSTLQWNMSFHRYLITFHLWYHDSTLYTGYGSARLIPEQWGYCYSSLQQKEAPRAFLITIWSELILVPSSKPKLKVYITLNQVSFIAVKKPPQNTLCSHVIWRKFLSAAVDTQTKVRIPMTFRCLLYAQSRSKVESSSILPAELFL